MSQKRITFQYDQEGDVLYAFFGKPKESVYDAVGGGVYIRKDPHTKKPIGFMIIDYGRRMQIGKLPPIPHFENIGIPPLKEISL